MMNVFRLLLVLFFVPFGHAAETAPSTRSARFDAGGRFEVQATIPAGSDHAVLEVSGDLTQWRAMIAGEIDGRAARVIFRLPPQGEPRLFARVRTGNGNAPPVELSGPELFSAIYDEGIDSQVKIDFLMAAGAKMREWLHLPRPQSQANLIAWALGHAEVASAEVAPWSDNVSIRFADGDICVLLNRPRDSEGADVPPSAYAEMVGEAPAAMAPASFPTAAGLPGANRAVTAFSLESSFPNSSQTIGGWLGARGYAVNHFGSTTVDQIKSWSSAWNPIGVLFWQVHGCSYIAKGGSEGIGLVTMQHTSAALDNGPYKEMRDNGELLMAKDSSEGAKPYYMITGKFVRKHLRFAPHSLVVLDSCEAAHPEIAGAFLDAGAGSFASWDWYSGNQSGKPCRQLFDRLLGMNTEAPFSVPEERAFSLPVVRQWMEFSGYDIDPSLKYPDQTRSNAKLTWFHHPQTPAHLLQPSVMRVMHEFSSGAEPFTKFLIEGDFGDDPGASKRSVLWGGKPMQVLRWDARDGIVIRPPADPPTGGIQVILNKDFRTESNVVPITEWTVPFTYEIFGEG